MSQIMSMDSNLLISVIIPTKNCKAYIARAINSVLEQNIGSIEILVIDDASDDGTDLLIASEFGHTDKIRLIRHPEPRMCGAARNTGLSESQGKYIFFLDADDWINHGCLDHLLKIAEENTLDIAACGANIISEDGNSTKYHGKIIACHDKLTGLRHFSEHAIASVVWNKLYLKSYIDDHKIRFHSHYHHGDVRFTAEVLANNPKYLSIEESYYNYYQRGDSISNAALKQIHLESHLNIHKALDEALSDMIDRANAHDIYLKIMEAHYTYPLVSLTERYINANGEDAFKRDFMEACISLYGNNGYVIYNTFTANWIYLKRRSKKEISILRIKYKNRSKKWSIKKMLKTLFTTSVFTKGS